MDLDITQITKNKRKKITKNKKARRKNKKKEQGPGKYFNCRKFGH